LAVVGLEAIGGLEVMQPLGGHAEFVLANCRQSEQRRSDADRFALEAAELVPLPLLPVTQW
jgi:hypothetical protein